MPTDPSPADLSALRIPRDRRAPRGGRTTGRWIAIGIGIAAALGWFGLRGTKLPKLPGRSAAARVETTRVVSVSPTDADQVLTATGYVVARMKADISSRIVGRLAELNVEEGMKVRRGHVIARLEDADYRAALEEARAVAAEADLAAARLARLVSEKIASAAELDAAVARRDSARARVSLAEANLENTIVRAPFDGVVLTKKAKVGETVAPGGFSAGGSTGSSSAIATIADFRTLEVEADVTEANIGRIEAGQPAEIAVDAVPDRRFRARLDRIVPTADRQKATVQVKVRFEETDRRLLPEMQATVKFLKSGSTAAPAPPKVLVPASAVETTPEGTKRVRLLVDGNLASRTVETKEAGDGKVEVTTGLSGGEELVLTGAAGLPDGAPATTAAAPK